MLSSYSYGMPAHSAAAAQGDTEPSLWCTRQGLYLSRCGLMPMVFRKR